MASIVSRLHVFNKQSVCCHSGVLRSILDMGNIWGRVWIYVKKVCLHTQMLALLFLCQLGLRCKVTHKLRCIQSKGLVSRLCFTDQMDTICYWLSKSMNRLLLLDPKQLLLRLTGWERGDLPQRLQLFFEITLNHGLKRHQRCSLLGPIRFSIPGISSQRPWTFIWHFDSGFVPFMLYRSGGWSGELC